MRQQLILKQQQQQKQQLTVSQILRTYGKQFRQITNCYSDGRDGRCAISVILSYFGWDGKLDSDLTPSIQAALPILSNIGLDDEFSIIELNDAGWSFDEIADYIDRIGKLVDTADYLNQTLQHNFRHLELELAH